MPVAFDTHALIQRLLHGNVPLEQAEAISAALSEALDDVIGTLATKKDLASLETNLTRAITRLSTRLTWMVGVYGGITVLILGKLLLFK